MASTTENKISCKLVVLSKFLISSLLIKSFVISSSIGIFLPPLIFSFGLTVFIQPEILGFSEATKMVSGGSSGLAQVLKLVVHMLNGELSEQKLTLIFNIFYFGINIPLLILAFIGVGKRFATFTLINVSCVVLFNSLFSIEGTATYEALHEIADHIMKEGGGELSRAFFAGICTGLSSAIAFKTESSAGGFDIVSYYISNKKSTLAGKYGVFINGGVITSFAVVSLIETKNIADPIIGVCFSIVYLLTVMVVIDIINIRNKKAQIQIISSNKELPKLLIANIPHGATLTQAKGVFTEEEKIIIYMVVSTSEIKKAVNVIRVLDPHSFVNVTMLQNVYGNFHIKPVK